MYQVNFSNQSMAEMNKLSVAEQMALVEAVSGLTAEQLNSASGVGVFNRDGKAFYRLRHGDLRVYFEVGDGVLNCKCILHKHTLADLTFRMKLPFKEEQQLEQDQSFWRIIENDGELGEKP